MEHSWSMNLIEFGKITVPAVIAVLGTLGATLLAHRNIKRQVITAKAVDFSERRIREFYSPMVGTVSRIRALSELRVEMSRAADAAWRQICDRSPKPFVDHEQAYKPFEAIITYENEQLYAEVIPAYDRLVEIFTSNYWLADEETQKHYGSLCRFVEIWHRYKAGSIPREVLLELKHSEEALHPLYEGLQRKMKEYTNLQEANA